MYPLKLSKNLLEKVWGGNKFKKYLNFDIDGDKNYGESWEVSYREGILSYIENGEFAGKSIKEVIEVYREKILGEKVIEFCEEKFPILIKYLDINDKLSIQVHPKKDEYWYVVEASEDARIILGKNKNISKEEFLKKVNENEFDGTFNEIKVNRGDFIKLEQGMIHATSKGKVLIYEIQQNSDITYRIHDYYRKINGKLRELHLDKALDTIDFNKKGEIISEKIRKKIPFKGGIREILDSGGHFNIEKLIVDEELSDEINDIFKIYSVLDGEGEMFCEGKSYPCKKGETYLIPAKLKIKIRGKIEILKTYIKNPPT
ncbi:type I phosphomannose isomerase catalytic subunit [Fusobacterium sp. MFO224]|uniref:type I phosphomannose isomerase catalytic subunit n=1 Tax=Fusobacterium sp. MFO224 TaxID=3378070 RepID=UPI0038527961